MNHSNSLPVIGISGGTSLCWRRSGKYFKSYSAPLATAGGTCVPLGAYAGRSLARCDGLLVPGGWDVHPDLYDRPAGDESLSALEIMSKYRVRCEVKKDETEMAHIREALAAGKPILAICRGIQSLNVVLARKLIPDIRSLVPDALTHRSVGIGQSLSHEVSVEPDSLIERAYGGRRVVVNTRHHQGLLPDMVHESLRVTAVAPDGIVEAVEGLGEQFIVGVQWHPERQKDAFIHDISGPLFEAFVQACRVSQTKTQRSQS